MKNLSIKKGLFFSIAFITFGLAIYFLAFRFNGVQKDVSPDFPFESKYIDYRFVDHSRYLEEFIKKMELKNITLVIHDVGAGLGSHYAMRHQSNVKGIAFMDGTVAPLSKEKMGFAERDMFKKFRDPEDGPNGL